MHICKPVFHNGKLNSIRIKFVFYVVDLYYYIQISFSSEYRNYVNTVCISEIHVILCYFLSVYTVLVIYHNKI